MNDPQTLTSAAELAFKAGARELRAMLDACTGFQPWTARDANRWWELHQPEPAHKASL